MIATNRENLVMQSVAGKVTGAKIHPRVWRVSAEGKPYLLPGTGGITYNFRIGDRCVGLQGDHVEPGVSIQNADIDGKGMENTALNALTCVGNEARVVDGDAKGARGRVTGKHGGIEHVLIDFEPEVLEKLAVGDRIQIKAYGAGLELPGIPEVKVMNLSPDLLEVMNVTQRKGKLQVPVTHLIPAKVMGSGLGANQAYTGDYDIQMFDESVVEQHGLKNLRFGDIVAITDADCSYGRIFFEGAMTIGVVVHSASAVAGHGPGVTTLLTSRAGRIAPILKPDANLRTFFPLLEGHH
jgi:hypothetical protein